MLLSLYIMFCIIAFIVFLLALYFTDSYVNLFLWPLCLILFGGLFFASFNIQTSTVLIAYENATVINANLTQTSYNYMTSDLYHNESAFGWVFLVLAMLSVILFLWDIWRLKASESVSKK